VETRIEEPSLGFSDRQAAVGPYAKSADAQFQEMVVLFHWSNGHERWLSQITEKCGLQLERSGERPPPRIPVAHRNALHHFAILTQAK
jgi:hypothetical protein